MLGQGAFGKVYMGMDLTTGELMAVKVVRGDDLGSLEHEVIFFIYIYFHPLKSSYSLYLCVFFF